MNERAVVMWRIVRSHVPHGAEQTERGGGFLPPGGTHRSACRWQRGRAKGAEYRRKIAPYFVRDPRCRALHQLEGTLAHASPPERAGLACGASDHAQWNDPTAETFQGRHCPLLIRCQLRVHLRRYGQPPEGVA
eukprot:1192479-Prorocentrum_minimum.AAC.4